ncbi:MAG: DUF3987 domain-containing protein [Bacteroidaceae bacterium]|nr:DUF3987 domain-containing protein [Bacteroidaceae bacterium]
MNQENNNTLTTMNEENQPKSYTDVLRDTQQEEFPLLGEVTAPFMGNPLALMNSIYDEDGVVVPCPLPDSMTQCLPQMMSEPLSLYDDADIRTMLLMAMMPTLGSAMSNVRVRHGQRLYSLGMMNICVGPSASGKGSVGDVASLVDGINKIICEESAQAQSDHRKRHTRYKRLSSQLNFAAKGDVSQLVDVNDIAGEVDEPQAPLRRMHKLPAKTTAANYYRLLYANGDNISYLHIPELAEMSAANKGSFGDFIYILLAAQNEEQLHTGRKTDDEDYLIEHTRLAMAATGTMSSVREFIPNLEDGLSTRFLYHCLPAKSTVRGEMDEATAEAFIDVYGHHRGVLTDIWKELRPFEGKTDEELPRLIITDEQRKYIDEYYRQLVSFISLTQPDSDLRAPILRSRLNLYRMQMIIAVLRRYEELGSVEGMFTEKRFTIAEADLKWGLAYIFYCMMQTSTIYDRLRREEREEPKRTCISPLAFVQLLSHQFTTAVATKLGEEMGIKERAVRHHLRTLCLKGYIERLRQGVYRKVARRINGKKKSSVIAQDSVILSQDTPRDASLRSA